MASLGRFSALALGMCLGIVSCVTAPPPGPRPEAEAPQEKASPAQMPSPNTVTEELPGEPPSAPQTPGPEVLRLLPQSPRPLSPGSQEVSWFTVTPLDLESWPFGWVQEPLTSTQLGLASRFWSDQRLRWKQALSPSSPWPTRIWLLTQIYAHATSDEEALRSAWLAAQTTSQASLWEDSRSWLDRAAQRSRSPVIALERAWDQYFRLQDPMGARTIGPPASTQWFSEAMAQKARLLRQRLFLGGLSLRSVGADDYLSTQVLDRDDLWGATWNGAIVRWSLTTDTLDLILAPSSTVSPIKLLAATGWFLYAFQDQSMLRYSKVTGTWRVFPYPAGWTGLRVQGVVTEGDESLWVAYLGQGLWRWEKGQWSLVDDGGGGPFLNALASDGNGGFWVGTKDRGLWSWKAGTWSQVRSLGGPSPTNISVIQPDPTGTRWLIGTWGEGTWVLDSGGLTPWSTDPEYVTAATWTEEGPLWGALDLGLVRKGTSGTEVLGVADGLPPGGVSTLVTWEGRWIWGTNGQGWGWWSENENPALLR